MGDRYEELLRAGTGGASGRAAIMMGVAAARKDRAAMRSIAEALAHEDPVACAAALHLSVLANAELLTEKHGQPTGYRARGDWN